VSVVVVILAAGRGERLGGVAKALFTGRDGRPFLTAIADAAADAGVGPALVVVGPPFRDAVAEEAVQLGMTVVDNPRPQRGMASSVAVGFARALAASTADGALLWPVDHAGVAAATVRLIVDEAARQDTAQRIVVPTYQGRGGHPTFFGRAIWPELSACGAATDGARSVVRRDAARVTRIAVADMGVVADVDQPEEVR
jgi:molybdenum cofactor cytidylyltransferase